MTKNEIAVVLDKHKKWLNNEEGGERANLRDADLSGADLRDADLRDADLRCADLRDAGLSAADLSGANLRDADLSDADLRDANLRCADLSAAAMYHADLSDTDLSDTDLRDAGLNAADLSGANLDHSCWPLWCGSLGVHIDDRIALQLLYHLLYNFKYSKHVSDEIKRVLLTPEIVELANLSHVVHQHKKAKIEPYKEENHDCIT